MCNALKTSSFSERGRGCAAYACTVNGARVRGVRRVGAPCVARGRAGVGVRMRA